MAKLMQEELKCPLYLLVAAWNSKVIFQNSLQRATKTMTKNKQVTRLILWREVMVIRRIQFIDLSIKVFVFC